MGASSHSVFPVPPSSSRTSFSRPSSSIGSVWLYRKHSCLLLRRCASMIFSYSRSSCAVCPYSVKTFPLSICSFKLMLFPRPLSVVFPQMYMYDIHSPHTRGDGQIREHGLNARISIHSPHARGDLTLLRQVSYTLNFNPLPSYEGRPRRRR